LAEGGRIVYGINNETTHLVSSHQQIIQISFQVRTAYRHGLWVVLPSFVLRSQEIKKKEDEWNHILINGKDATEFASNSEQFVKTRLAKGIRNINEALISVRHVEKKMEDSIANIHALCVSIIKSISGFDYSHLDTSKLIPQLHLMLERNPINQPKSHRINWKEDKESPVRPNSFIRNNPLHYVPKKVNEVSHSLYQKEDISHYQQKPTFKSTIPRPLHSTAFFERVQEKRKQREEKLRIIEEDRIKREELTKKREEEVAERAKEYLNQIENEKKEFKKNRRRRSSKFSIN